MSQAHVSPIDVKEAIRIAREYMQSIYQGEPISNLLLEEVILSDDEQFWHITYGFDTQREYEEVESSVGLPPLISRVVPKYAREYKQLVIRAADGHVEAMKIRKV